MTKAKPTAKTPFEVQDWPATRVEMWPLDKIKPYEKNARVHPQAEIDALALDMKTDGVTTAILVDEAGVIIFGHARRLAAKQNGFEQYPVCIARGWSEEQKKAVRLKDNHRPSMAQWDPGLLKFELDDLRSAGFDLKPFDFPEFSGFLVAGDGVQNSSAEWGGMPEFVQKDATAWRSIVVHFKDQAALDDFAKATNQRINEKTRFLWYPNIEIVPFVKVKTREAKPKAKNK